MKRIQSNYFEFGPFQGGTSFVDHLCYFSLFCILRPLLNYDLDMICIYLFLKVVLTLANSADPNEM